MALYQFSKWLPCRISTGNGKKITVNPDLSNWIKEFKKKGINFKIEKDSEGRIALFKEGENPFKTNTNY